MRMEAYSTALYEHYKGTPGRVRERKEGTVTKAEQVFFFIIHRYRLGAYIGQIELI